MKIYTRPRPVSTLHVRDTDQVAVTAAGQLIRSVEQYVELDLAGEHHGQARVQWAAVLSVSPCPGRAGYWVLAHSRGEQERAARADVIVREVIELDPWSYLRRDW